jgi:prepilin signal peptidase PulO-like enzyme (type II secretory pathway)
MGPWSAPAPKTPSRKPSDRIPIWGWWQLRRESSLHGQGYWVRPLFIELLVPLFFVFLFWWEIQGQLIPTPPPLSKETLSWQFFAHAVLSCFMVMATFIDFDEQTIPDAITVPGTLVGLVLMTWHPDAFLPAGAGEVTWLTAPQPWLGSLNTHVGLLVGCGIFAAWSFALAPKLWWTRSGMTRAVKYWVASICRYGLWHGVMAVVGCSAIAAVWWWGRETEHWQGLLTALVGMAGGGAIVWLVRIVAGLALQREAMGFGDVTLMAMIGCYVGWQASVLVFFMAPFAGAVIGLIQLIVSRRTELAYGPYLCGAAIVLLIFWPDLWLASYRHFEILWLIPAMFVVCMAPMGVLLWLYRAIRRGD